MKVKEEHTEPAQFGSIEVNEMTSDVITDQRLELMTYVQRYRL